MYLVKQKLLKLLFSVVIILPSFLPTVTVLASDDGEYKIEDVSGIETINHTMMSETELEKQVTIASIFEDNTLAEMVANELDVNVNDVIPSYRFQEITTLQLSSSDIHQIDGLQYLTHLVSLDLSNNIIIDFTPLSDLINLENLYLNATGINDVSPLSDLVGLNTLHLNANEITDLRPLSQLNSTHIDARNQEIHLNSVEKSERISIPLFSQNSTALTITSSSATFTFLNQILTWQTAGDNDLTWEDNVSNTYFSGTLFQTVTERLDHEGTLAFEVEPIKRTVTVIGGTGGGQHAVGSAVTIRVNIPSGQRFVRWTTTNPNVTFVNENSDTTTFVMPDADVTIIAAFEEITAPDPIRNLNRPALVRNPVALHRGPGTGYYLNRHVNRGTRITVLNMGQHGWSFVQIGSPAVTGWMQSSQIVEIHATGLITGTNVSFRANPGAGTLFRRLRRNVEVLILGQHANGRFTEIRVGGQVGWVQTSSIRAISRPGRITRLTALRRGPGTAFETMRSLGYNEQLQVLGRQNNWVRVRVG